MELNKMLELKKSLVEPLENTDLHFYHSCEYLEKSIKGLKNAIRDKVYGCYLVGGLRGVGKTSFVNLCCNCNDAFNKVIKVNINMASIDKIENLLLYIIRELYYSMEIEKVDESIIDELRTMYIKTFLLVNNNSRITIGEVNTKEGEETNIKKYKVSILPKIPVLEKFLSIGTDKLKEDSINKKSQQIDAINKCYEVTEVFDEHTRFLELKHILRKLSESKHTIIFTYDELDKMEPDSLELVFRLYKDLFLNYRTINIFIVGYDEFNKYASDDIKSNPLNTYFIGKYYVPTMDYMNFQMYCYKVFPIEEQLKMHEIYYSTLGILRNINTYMYNNYGQDKFFQEKAFLFTKTMVDLYSNMIERQSLDIFKYNLKQLIDYIFDYAPIRYEDAKNFLDKLNKNLSNVSITFEKVINSILKHSKVLNNIISIKYEKDFTKYLNVINISFEDKMKWIDDINKKKVDIDDLYPYFSSLRFWEINRNLLVSKVEPITICRRKRNGFKILKRIIESSIYNLKNLIIIEKHFDYMGGEGISYSSILLLELPIGYVAYIVEDCSFSYEDSIISDYKEFLKKNDIKMITLKYDEISIEDNIQMILEDLDREIYG